MFLFFFLEHRLVGTCPHTVFELGEYNFDGRRVQSPLFGRNFILVGQRRVGPTGWTHFVNYFWTPVSTSPPQKECGCHETGGPG